MKLHALAVAILAALPCSSEAAAQAAAQDRKDRVTLKKGAPVEGEIQKDTWKEVVVKTGAATQTIKVDEVQKVEYWDAPPAFKGAMAAVEQEKWSEAISALGSAEEYANSKEKNILKPRAWFPSYLTFYRGLCMMQVGRTDDAVRQFDRLRKEMKECRFIAQAYELTLEAYREKGDVAKMDEFEKEIEQAPAEIKTELQTRARRQRAELLYDKAKYEDAKRLFETITTAADPEIAAASTAGVIRCLSGLKDASGVDGYCKKVLATSTQPSLLLIASNALGDALFDKKQFAQARDQYIQSVVKYNPGRTGGGIEREHEKALYRLASSYEGLIEGAKDPKAKESIMIMASSSFRELSIEYPSGKYREEAVSKAQKYEPKDEKK